MFVFEANIFLINYENQNGPGTSYMSLSRLPNMFRTLPSLDHSGTLIQKLLFQKNSIGNLCKLFHDVKIPPISTYSVNLKTNMKDENYKNFNISRTK